MPIVKCSQCGKEFIKTPYQAKRSKNHFCTRECHAEYDKKDKILVKCSFCGKEIFKTQYEVNKFEYSFCTKQCGYNFRRGKNNIVTENDYAKIIIDSKIYGKLEAIIDIDDIYIVEKYNWNARKDTKSGMFYIKCYDFKNIGEKRKTIHLHRLITNCPDNLEVDHINRNPLDNRKVNLKVCTHKENCLNKDYEMIIKKRMINAK